MQLSLSATSADPARQRPVLEGAIRQLGRSIDDARRIAASIAPLESTRGSLQLALEQLVAGANSPDCRCQLECVNLPASLPRVAADSAWRAVRDLLRVARGDTAARAVFLRVSAVQGELRVDGQFALPVEADEVAALATLRESAVGPAARSAGAVDGRLSPAGCHFWLRMPLAQ